MLWFASDARAYLSDFQGSFRWRKVLWCRCEVRQPYAPAFSSERFARSSAMVRSMAAGATSSTGRPRQIGRAQSELQSRFDLVCRLLLETKKHNATRIG